MPALPVRPAPSPARPAQDKREAILAAALRLIARTGLHNTPMSALAREARVAAGTLYLYFPSKEAMVNALYLELLEDRDRALTADASRDGRPPTGLRGALWESWHGLARWHLDRPEASNFLQQCRASGILTDETREVEQRLYAAGVSRFDDALARGRLRPVSRHVFYALFVGPIAALVQLRDAGELTATDGVLRATFDGVCRSVLPAAGEPAS